jgi:hypothetical protein
VKFKLTASFWLVNFNYSLQKIDYTLSFFLNAIAFSYHQGKHTVSLIREFWDTLYIRLQKLHPGNHVRRVNFCQEFLLIKILIFFKSSGQMKQNSVNEGCLIEKIAIFGRTKSSDYSGGEKPNSISD